MSNPEGNSKVENREGEPKPFSDTIVAVDVDGVLIQPIAYRQAINNTLSFFAGKLGVDPQNYTLDDENKTFGRSMSHFEAKGIHDPWDVSTIIVSLMRIEKEGINISCGEALKIYSDDPNKTAHPPEAVLNGIKTKYQGILSEETFAEITQCLTDTREPTRNNVTGVFQEYVLGAEIFERTYGKKSQTGAIESLIETQDRLLVNFDGLNSLSRITEGGGKVVVYTGRPGLPPLDVPEKPNDGFSPEAELAINKSQVNALGPITMGSMQWLAGETNNSVESLTKPNPTQAVATIIAALRETKTNSQVLLDAYKWVKEGIIPEEVREIIENKNQKPLEIVILEDTTSGVTAFINAKKIFDSVGLKTNIVVIGVHGGNEEKYNSFRQLAEKEQLTAITCTTINDGVRSYVEQKQKGEI